MYEARLLERLPAVRERIEQARAHAGGDGPVDIVAVTKGHPVAAVEAALRAGLPRCGENRVQELAAKVESVGDGPSAAGVEWHLIGHLQRNKVRQALPLFRMIHSIDSPRLARELSKEAGKAGIEVHGLVQVNVAGEDAKGGFAPDEVVDAVGAIAELPGLRIVGLMTMAPLTEDEGVLRRTFQGARRAFDACAEQLPAFDARHLSMGMSNDYQLAVEEGSTMVRLGTVLFGERAS